ncbi:MAG: hypothetical protein QM533_06505 [Cytophagales bacterium]|nr:hypothetical protein [Cytophagales bacterium]
MQHATNSKLAAFLLHYWPITYVVMLLSFLAFGASSFNLAKTFLITVQLISEYGVMALIDGAFAQLVELVLTAALSVGFYISFKTCESVLVQRLLSTPTQDHGQTQAD